MALQVANASQASVDNYATATTQSTTSAVVDINAGSAVVNNHAGATLTGASDFAVNGRTGNVTINNDGTLYGYVTLQGSGNAFNNNSSQSFDLRNYVAGVQSVAVAQINGVFNNNANGVLRLLAESNPQSVNNSGAWQTAGSLLPGNGVVQGQLTGVSNFTNSGVITLQEWITAPAKPWRAICWSLPAVMRRVLPAAASIPRTADSCAWMPC